MTWQGHTGCNRQRQDPHPQPSPSPHSTPRLSPSTAPHLPAGLSCTFPAGAGAEAARSEQGRVGGRAWGGWVSSSCHPLSPPGRMHKP